MLSRPQSRDGILDALAPCSMIPAPRLWYRRGKFAKIGIEHRNNFVHQSHPFLHSRFPWRSGPSKQISPKSLPYETSASKYCVVTYLTFYTTHVLLYEISHIWGSPGVNGESRFNISSHYFQIDEFSPCPASLAIRT